MIPQLILIALFALLIYRKLKNYSYSQKAKQEFYNLLLGILLLSILLVWGGFFRPFGL